MRKALTHLRSLVRSLLLIALVAIGTLALVRYAPGYFADSGELDATHSAASRTELARLRVADASIFTMARTACLGWIHGNLGVSRQYGVPVRELIVPRLALTASLLARSLAFGWLTALALALPLSGGRGSAHEAAVAACSALLLAVPVGALATFCLLTGNGGPTFTVGALLAARDFKFLYRLLRRERAAPYVLFARAQGLGMRRIVSAHLLPALLMNLRALLTLSFVTALGMIVPAEVIFDIPGLGQLAWNAAINRDAPVLLAVTLVVAAAVGLSGSLGNAAMRAEAA